MRQNIVYVVMEEYLTIDLTQYKSIDSIYTNKIDADYRAHRALVNAKEHGVETAYYYVVEWELK